jgi:GTP cyclohydrolase I
MIPKLKAKVSLMTSVLKLLEALEQEGYIDLKDENFRETPRRVTDMYREIFTPKSQIDKEVKSILSHHTFPGGNYDGIIALKGLRIFSMCPHHLCPIEQEVAIAYIPKMRVIGLSKLARLVRLVAGQPILQEKMTKDITRYMMKGLKPQGCGCFIKARHFCMIMRGVKQEDSITITSSLAGNFYDSEIKNEFFSLVR